ncbi:hypothetical protein Trco_004804 [Trichoderma cornu-damae]|uniref:CST complex subunit STN1 n=1 Tax=Trichoderma cornu-damae TaxID=654480 RepID=A0A9P8QGF0_9HYPO|nr:hypothetical protein Trco_004804 [Trichoderma cornu-damae]
MDACAQVAGASRHQDGHPVSGATKATLYPRYCFHLSPTANAWCLLRVAEIHALDQHPGFEGENFFFYKNLPIKWVRVVGVVVAIEQYVNRRLYTIDDGSGRNILALVMPPAPAKPKNGSTAGEQPTETDPQDADPYADVDVGVVVDVKGGVSAFRSERQISVEKMVVVKGTAQEVVLWEKRTKFRREVLDAPWLLQEKDIRQCRRDAERPEVLEAQREKKARKQSRAREANRDDEKPLAKDTKDKTARGGDNDSNDNDAAKRMRRIQRMIREGALTGRYSALGL